jgi:hypothetical protein
MKIFGTIFFAAFLLCSVMKAQEKEQASLPSEKTHINQYDEKGKKQGLWLNTTAARMGEPGTNEFGNYDHGKKYGIWYKIDDQGDLVSIETFRNNVLDGEVKYYNMGRLYCIGHYRGLTPTQKYDTIMVMHPITHEEAYKVISTENGTMRHGTWQYFNPQSGQLVREEEYQVDELVYKKDYEVSAARDSAYMKQHIEALPHNQGKIASPPPGKRFSYTNY